MKLSLLHLLAAAGAAGTVVTAALSLENGNPELTPSAMKTAAEAKPDAIPFHSEGDWYRYAAPAYSLPGVRGKISDDTTFESDSHIGFGAGYGHSMFTQSKYRLFDGDRPVSNVIKNDVFASNDIRLMVQGHVGKRLDVYIDHDSKREKEEENVYRMRYRAVEDDEVIREINAGDIDVKIDGSKYAVYDSGSQKSLGIDSTIRRGKLTLKGFMSVSKGSEETENFRGASSASSSSVSDYQYVRNTCFQIEPYLRYDGIVSAALVSFPSAYAALITFTSAPADPAAYTPFAVNIAPASVEIWYDPQTSVANANAVVFTPDGGSYVKLAEGTDYRISYVTGEVVFLRAVSAQSRIVAGYKLAGGAASSDPAVRTDIIAGKNAVYLKFGTSIDEDPGRDGTSDGDVNGDGKINHDVYEIRSRYVIGDRDIRPENFSFTLYEGTKKAPASDKTKLGRYTIDYNSGTLNYLLREPFRSLLSAGAASRIYSQTGSDLYEASAYSQKFEYVREARSFQLKHLNVVEGSVRVRVDGRDLSPSLFTVNAVSGTVMFTDANNPVIGDSTGIEISYQYAESELSQRGFLAGVRGDYRFNEMLSFGSTALYSRSNATDVVPEQGNEPTQNLVFEGDTTLTVSDAKFGKLAHALTGGAADTLPLSFSGYAEYAHSIYDVNTFGKMLVDDMESDTEEAVVSLSERDWILSSMPSGSAQADRASLLYKYYRSLGSLSTLRGFGFTPYEIPYASKAGPYNVCDGHITYSDSSRNSARRTLVFEADFTTGTCAAAATRINGGTETDLSALQYVELWYRSTGGTGSAELSLDIGRISEDADGTGVLKSEDVNRNGYLDRDPSAGIDEDIGYAFTPAGKPSTRVGNGPGLNSVTTGDGTLTTEDLNGNGTLDTAEKTISFPGTNAWKDDDLAYSALSLDLADTSWKKARIYLKRNTLTEADIYKLRHAVALRLNMRSSTASKAVICIDSLRLVSARWKEVAINGVVNEDTTMMKVNLVDSIDDAEYRANSFMSRERSEYTSLYGDRTDDDINDEKESALALVYNLSGGNASVTRRFSRTLDLRRYHTLSMWLNPREVTSGDVLRFYCCTSSGDYTWYDIPLNWSQGWRKVTLKLDSGSGGQFPAAGTAGVPDRGAVTMLKAGIVGGAGRLWINTILAAEPYTLTGDAYWVEGTAKVTRPLYITGGGTAVARDLTFTARRKFHSGDYNSPGRSDLGMSDDTNELSSSVELLPGWKNSLAASFRRTNVGSFDPAFTDSDRGKTSRDSCSFISEYRGEDPYSPFLQFWYRGENSEKVRDEYINSSRVAEKTDSASYAPGFAYEQSIKDPFDGVLRVRTVLDNTFSRETTERNETGSAALTADDMTAREREARQKNSLSCLFDYSLGKIFISPQCRIVRSDIVESSNSGEMTGSILNPVSGGFHLPFASAGDTKAVERADGYSFSWGLRDFPACALSDSLNFDYSQNAFNDYTSSEKNDYEGFMRDHSSTASATRTLTVPFTFKEPLFTFIRSATFSWSRKIQFSETGVPFEGEGHGFYDEDYGMRRSLSASAPEVLDVYSYSPWHFLLGRGNCANARDHLNMKLNTPLEIGGTAVSSYDNTLSMIEDLGFSNSLVFKGVSVDSGISAHQVTGRESVSSLPGQQMTLSANGMAGFDIATLFPFGFFRPDEGKSGTRSARFTIGYVFARTMIFTANTLEDSHQPSAGLTFHWGHSVFSINSGVDLRHRISHDFISSDDAKRPAADDPYYDAMTHEKIDERTTGYTFKTRYETDVPALAKFFAPYYELTGVPLFSLEYSLILNRYDYSYSVSPEPYDQHLLTAKLDADIHKNVRGGLTAQMALERWYNRETNGLFREIVSYDVAFNVTIKF